MAEKYATTHKNDWLKQAEAAAYLNCTARHIRHLQATGKLPGYRLAGGRAMRYKRADLDALLVRVPTVGEA